MGKTAKFLRHAPCPHCGSSDAYSLYSNGSAYCFSCNTHDRVAYQIEEQPKVQSTLLPVGQYGPLPERKLTKQVCEAYGYFTTTHLGKFVQVAPYFYKNTLVAQHVRFPDKTFVWVGDARKVELFGQHLWPPGGARLVITEGEIDCLSVAQIFNLKTPVVSIPNGAAAAKTAIARNLKFIDSFREVVLCFDNDDEGKKAVQTVAPLLQPGKVKVFRYPTTEGIKDANDLLQQGQGTLIAEGVLNAVPFRPDGILNGNELYDVMWSELPYGFTTPYPQLDQLLCGFRKGELYLFTAGSGLGKSTVVHEIAAHFLIEHKLKIGVLALEENPRRTAERYGTVVLNKPLHLPFVKSRLTEDEKRKAFEATLGTGRFWVYDHFGSSQIDNLFANIRFLTVGCEVDFVVIDHLSIVVSGLDEMLGDERKLIDRLMTKLRQLVEETGVGVLAVVHLSRPKDGTSWNEGRAVTLAALRGSGALEQLSDVVISLERNQYSDEPDKSILRVLKNRPIGKVGVADTVLYNHDTGRLLPVVDDFKQQPDF